MSLALRTIVSTLVGPGAGGRLRALVDSDPRRRDTWAGRPVRPRTHRRRRRPVHCMREL